MKKEEKIYKYDKNKDLIYYKDNDCEIWWEYNKNGTRHFKHSNGSECWYRYDECGNQVGISKRDFNRYKNEEIRKEFLFKNKYCNRFELMDI